MPLRSSTIANILKSEAGQMKTESAKCVLALRAPNPVSRSMFRTNVLGSPFYARTYGRASQEQVPRSKAEPDFIKFSDFLPQHLSRRYTT